MRKIKDVLRLKFQLHLSDRQIARSCALARSTVAEYVHRAQRAGLTWPLPEGWDDRAIQNRLFPPTGKSPPDPRPLPDFATVHEERCRHKHVTLMLLWDEYKQAYPEGYQYSQFCDLYHRWRRQLDLVLRQEHRAGEKLFVDYAGDTVPIVDRHTGETQDASIFVAVLGAKQLYLCGSLPTAGLTLVARGSHPGSGVPGGLPLRRGPRQHQRCGPSPLSL